MSHFKHEPLILKVCIRWNYVVGCTSRPPYLQTEGAHCQLDLISRYWHCGEEVARLMSGIEHKFSDVTEIFHLRLLYEISSFSHVTFGSVLNFLATEVSAIFSKRLNTLFLTSLQTLLIWGLPSGPPTVTRISDLVCARHLGFPRWWNLLH
jgi:hypothetical protein